MWNRLTNRGLLFDEMQKKALENSRAFSYVKRCFLVDTYGPTSSPSGNIGSCTVSNS